MQLMLSNAAFIVYIIYLVRAAYSNLWLCSFLISNLYFFYIFRPQNLCCKFYIVSKKSWFEKFQSFFALIFSSSTKCIPAIQLYQLKIVQNLYGTQVVWCCCLVWVYKTYRTLLRLWSSFLFLYNNIWWFICQL